VTYSWPVQPFDNQHAVRGFFCDPRIGDQGGKSFHFGVDVSAQDGTPVYAVEAGTVHLEGEQNIAVVGSREHGYWHVVPAVTHLQQVPQHGLLGHIAPGWGHVHFADHSNGQYWNPLRQGALTPFEDYGAPVVDRVVAERNGGKLDPTELTGVIDLVVEAHDNPPISAPPPWHGIPVTPALVRWRLVRDAAEVVPWTVVADFRATLIQQSHFDLVYADGTRQNHPNAPGLFRFWLARGWDTRPHRDGYYRLDVEAADIRGNASRGHLDIQFVNSSV
jgi:hypothetical protein